MLLVESVVDAIAGLQGPCTLGFSSCPAAQEQCHLLDKVIGLAAQLLEDPWPGLVSILEPTVQDAEPMEGDSPLPPAVGRIYVGSAVCWVMASPAGVASTWTQ